MVQRQKAAARRACLSLSGLYGNLINGPKKGFHLFYFYFYLFLSTINFFLDIYKYKIVCFCLLSKMNTCRSSFGKIYQTVCIILSWCKLTMQNVKDCRIIGQAVGGCLHYEIFFLYGDILVPHNFAASDCAILAEWNPQHSLSALYLWTQTLKEAGTRRSF